MYLKLAFEERKKFVYLKQRFEERKKFVYLKQRFEERKKFVYLKLAFEEPKFIDIFIKIYGIRKINEKKVPKSKGKIDKFPLKNVSKNRFWKKALKKKKVRGPDHQTTRPPDHQTTRPPDHHFTI